MPAIDLARLRKQANRLADFFFVPEEFLKQLREVSEFYVNHSLRTKENVAPGSNLPTFRTPAVVTRQIENAIGPIARENAHYALELADLLWDEGYIETRMLAAFLLGCIPPQEETPARPPDCLDPANTRPQRPQRPVDDQPGAYAHRDAGRFFDPDPGVDPPGAPGSMVEWHPGFAAADHGP